MLLVDEKHIGKKIGIIHHIKGGYRPIARAGTLVVPEFGVIRLTEVTETTRGACRVRDAWASLPEDVKGVLEIKGYEGLATIQPLKPR